MLPSKGFFSSINCPHYDAGCCERPHCHFRHVKREKPETVEEGPNVSETAIIKQDTTGKGDDALLKHLVTEAVKQVLSHSEVREKAEGSPLDTSAIVSDVVNKLQPSINSVQRDVSKPSIENATTSSFISPPSYKPTPISELKKRHIPVMYAPEKPSSSIRKFKRPACGKERLQYIPKLVDGSQISSSIYKPSQTEKNYKSMEYAPDGGTSGGHAYIPSKIDDLCDSNKVNIALGSVEDSNSMSTKQVPDLMQNSDLSFDNTDHGNCKSPPNTNLSVTLISDIKEVNSNVKIVNLDDSKTFHVVEKSTLPLTTLSDYISNKDGLSVESDQYNDQCQLMQVDGGESNSIPCQDTSKYDISNKKDSDLKSSREKKKSKHLSESKSNKRSSDTSSSHKRSHKSDSRITNLHKNDSYKSSSHKNEHHKSSDHKTDHHRGDSKTEHHRSRRGRNDYHKSDEQNKSDRKSRSQHKSHSNKSKHHRRDLKKTRHKEDMEKEEETMDDIHDLKHISDKNKRNNDEIYSDRKQTNRKRRHSVTGDTSSDSSDPIEITQVDDPILIESSPESSSTELEHGSENSEYEPQIKKRISHVIGDSRTVVATTAKPDLSPTKMLCERWQKARQAIQKSTPPGKVRISSVPNVSSILSARNEILKVTRVQKSKEEMDNPAPRQLTRIAHQPVCLSTLPVVEADSDTKIPIVIRQAYLNSIYEEYLKFYDPETAKCKAVILEKDIAGRSKATPTYKNAMAVARMRIRKNEGDIEDVAEEAETWTSSSAPEFTYGVSLYECLMKYLMSAEELEENGYPQEIPNMPGCAYIKPNLRYNKVCQPKDSNERICINCNKSYCVDELGIPTSIDDCHYHWGKTYKIKVSGCLISRYVCCNNELGSPPCTSNKYHVCELADEDCLEGFLRTEPKDLESDIYAGVFAMDCEMCYTVRGSEVTRVTLVDLNGETYFNKMIKPDFPILDYCTRFSGVTETSLIGITERLPDIQTMLLDIINNKTILIGHSLENDLKALKIFHDNVIDTSVVFPHKMGPPRKRALRHLTEEFLNVKIQNSEFGHDSAEDAKACMDLMIWKVKQDAKARKPRVILSLDSK